MPTTYLGLPLGSLSKARGTWYHIIEKLEPHFVGLKRCIYQKVKGLPSLRVHYLHIPLISYVFSRRQFMLQIDWSIFKGTSCRVGWEMQ